MSLQISVIYPFYNNHDMLRRQLEHIASLSEGTRNALEFVFVDDGSSVPMNIGTPDFNVQAFRVQRDIEWNQDGARNIGAHHARAERLLLVDIDMIIPEETLNAALEIKDDKIYTFRRALSDGTTVSPSPNCFLMTKKRYWKIGGYDEDYRGTYGTDRLWRRRLGERIELPVPLVNYMPEDIEDACTTNYSRDIGRKTRLKWLAIGFWKLISRRGIRVLREEYDRII